MTRERYDWRGDRWRGAVAGGVALSLWMLFLVWSAGTAGAAEVKEPARIVFLIGEDEYHTWETLPAFAEEEVKPRGFEVRVILQDPADKHRFPGLVEALKDADLLVVSVRRRALPEDQLMAVRRYLQAGGPLVGIRTTCHAFDPRGADVGRGAAWPEFDPEVLGGNYHGHHGAGPTVEVRVAPEVTPGDPLLSGVPQTFSSVGSLYRVSPLRPGTETLLVGAIPGQPAEPVAWLHRYGEQAARVFFTSLGHPKDFETPAFRRLLLNGIYWALDRPVPPVDGPRAEAGPSSGVAPGVASPPVLPLSPEESARRFTVADGLEWELVLSEPDIAQPLQISFDERGRLWLVEYRQYPAPAGLKQVSHDRFWRSVYDRVPPPPPHHFPGEDRISIHEDTDGDGTYDRHSVFVDGLNIATSAVRGRGGVWVLNPPYLLFYPDRNDDDVPDGDPEIHLEGFGLEDTHSVVNSLRWGPDGWLYAAQGSTVSGRVRRPGSTNEPVHTLGQNIWRYHPERRKYEVFAEGGGNAFGVEIDDNGWIFSGHNGGNTRGFHYVQGGYLQKGFEKHGQLSNPYAFGYFPPMAHPDVERFTHTFLFYGGGALSAEFDGRLFGVEPLQGRVVMSERSPVGTTFRTRDVGYAVTSADPWFKPVDIKLGPDGAMYVADWYDYQVNHWRNYQGNMDASNGRVYRLKARGAPSVRLPDLGKATASELVESLGSSNRWRRQTALRLLADRRDADIVARLHRQMAESDGQLALESLWALNLSGGFRGAAIPQALSHPQPHVREWAVRLLGDADPGPAGAGAWLESLAGREPDAAVRLQLAATARRLPPPEAVGILRQLVAWDADAEDARQPLMIWWAMEAKMTADRQSVWSLLDTPARWARPIVERHLLERIMRRLARAGGPADLDVCADLLRRAPSDSARAALLRGFEEAFRDRSLAGLPPGLVAELTRGGGGSLALQLRAGRAGALKEALSAAGDEAADEFLRVQVIQTLGEIKERQAIPALLEAVASGREAVRLAALGALQVFDGMGIGDRVIRGLGSASGPTLTAALGLLASRAGWSRQLLDAVGRGEVGQGIIGPEVRLQMRQQHDSEVEAGLNRLWPSDTGVGAGEAETEIARLTQVLRGGSGDPYAGKKLFSAACGVCHTLFHQGGAVGPDLTPFRRDDQDSLLLSVVRPSVEIREGYENFLLETTDDRSLSGFIVRQDDHGVVLRGLSGQDISVPRSEIAELRAAGLSLMPEGLLAGWDDQQVRDLFAYLRSSQPLAD